MDLFREIIYLNQKYKLKHKSIEIYELDEDEDEDDIEFIHSLRKNFINTYLKKNNCQFILSRDTLKKNYTFENTKN